MEIILQTDGAYFSFAFIPGFPVSGRNKTVNPPTNKHVISLPLKRKVNHSQRFPEILNRPGSDSPTTDSSVSKILWIFFRTKRSPRNVSKKGFEKPKKNISPEKSQKHKKLRGKKFAPAIFVGRGWLFLGLLPPKKKHQKFGWNQRTNLGISRLKPTLGCLFQIGRHNFN